MNSRITFFLVVISGLLCVELKAMEASSSAFTTPVKTAATAGRAEQQKTAPAEKIARHCISSEDSCCKKLFLGADEESDRSEGSVLEDDGMSDDYSDCRVSAEALEAEFCCKEHGEQTLEHGCFCCGNPVVIILLCQHMFCETCYLIVNNQQCCPGCCSDKH